MEAAPALDLATAVRKLDESAVKLVKRTTEILGAGEIRAAGDLEGLDEDVSLLDNCLSCLRDKIRTVAAQNLELTQHEQTIIQLSRKCLNIASELLGVFGSETTIKLKRHLQCFPAAFPTKWDERHIRRKIEILGHYKRQICCGIFIVLEAYQRLLVANVQLPFDEVDGFGARHARLKDAIQLVCDEESWCSSPSNDRQTAQNERSMHGSFVNAVMSALSFIEIEETRSNIATPCGSTFQWILPSDHALEEPDENLALWLKNGTGCFWIKGLPLRGKSTLMKYLHKVLKCGPDSSQRAEKQNLYICSYFFSEKGTHLQKSIEGLLRSLLFPLLGERTDLIPLLFPKFCRQWMYRQPGELIQLSLSDLVTAFLTLTTAPYVNIKICFLVDGINEFEGEPRELEELFSQATTSPRVKVLLSSRPTWDCAIMFSKLPKLQLEDFTARDIRQYVIDTLTADSIMQQMEALNSGAIDELVQRLLSRAQHNFLWVCVALGYLISVLQNTKRFSELWSELDKLPDQLSLLYRHIFRSYMAASGTESQQRLHLLLKSAEIEGGYHVTLFQLCLADMESHLDLSNTFLTSLDPQTKYLHCRYMKEKLVRDFGGLVKVYDAACRSHEFCGSLVQFVHNTAAEFLRNYLSEIGVDTTNDLAGRRAINLLLKSSLAELTATLPNPDSGYVNSLSYRALLRFFMYGNKSEYALQLCRSEYLPLLAKMMAEIWKAGRPKGHNKSPWMQDQGLFIEFASQHCSVELLWSLKVAMNDYISKRRASSEILEPMLLSRCAARETIQACFLQTGLPPWKTSRKSQNLSALRRESKKTYRAQHRENADADHPNGMTVESMCNSEFHVEDMERWRRGGELQRDGSYSIDGSWAQSSIPKVLHSTNGTGKHQDLPELHYASVGARFRLSDAYLGLDTSARTFRMNESLSFSNSCAPNQCLGQSAEWPSVGSDRREEDGLADDSRDYETPTRSLLTTAVSIGPCTSRWRVPPLGPRRQPKGLVMRKDLENRSTLDEKTSQSYENSLSIHRHAACLACKRRKTKCKPNPLDPYGPCVSCLRTMNSTLLRIPRRESILQSASLFREQQAPWPEWTSRWDSMDMQDIKDWNSTTTLDISITNCAAKTSYPLKVREFVPARDDKINQSWKKNGKDEFHTIKAYAIEDMHKAASNLHQHLDDNIGKYLIGFVGGSDRLFWDTFYAAFKWSNLAPTPAEGGLILDCLRLWVVSRMASHPESICNNDHISKVVTDVSSPYLNMRPLPPVMSAQLEIIMYATLLRPLRRRILVTLEALLKHEQPSNWLTVYFALFILLHNCALTTRRDAEFARRADLDTTFANPASIAEHQVGILVMLAHFHHDDRGAPLASLIDSSMSVQDFQAGAGLPHHLAQLVKQSAERVRGRELHIRDIRQRGASSDEYYFVSQLFDRPWQAPSIAI